MSLPPFADAPPLPELIRIACILEVTARKPGNIHRGADFEDAHYLDFLLSASAIGDALGRGVDQGVGAAVLRAVQATRRVVNTNTNLGMILLLAPLACAEGADLRSEVSRILDATTIKDTEHVYQAIRATRPGGLGHAVEQDVNDQPTVPLIEAMRLAADRDLIACQYVNGYAEVFDLALPALRAFLNTGRPLETAIIAAQLTLMARHPDTLIARKRGPEIARESARRAASVLDSGWPDAPGSAEQLAAFDAWLRADGHARNPGTSADLIAATLFVALRDGTFPLPISHWTSVE
ncbi:MAG: triphosphoribosyl-dephospho-CoA synthase [Isosphaeraceae bacterium]